MSAISVTTSTAASTATIWTTFPATPSITEATPAKSVSIVAAPTKMANVSGPNRINDPTKTAAVVA